MKTSNNKTSNNKSIRINEHIRSREIRVIDADGQMLGVMTVSEALAKARASKLDLVEISPNAVPPVCKIIDFGKYKYELQKKAHEAKKKQKTVEIKEIKVRPNIAIGDYNTKLRSAEKFLNEKNKVRVSMQFRGREIAHIDVGLVVIERFKNDLEEIAKMEVEPRREGKQIFMVLTPK